MPSTVEKQIWYEVFEEASKIFRGVNSRSGEEWGRVKVSLAAKIARILTKYFYTIDYIALSDLSGGECETSVNGSFDIDLVIKVRSPAEAYALATLEEIIDNAVKEAFFTTVNYEEYRRLLEHYQRGLKHNVVEMHINDVYALRLSKGLECPPIELYNSSSG
ncbi:hypothetical protein [Aeropyrum pernix]|uniref:hypothetical protein n=1 Tax=Aeropyrum pernix TaxID=56636 RepID=UPI001037F9FC|nr:hypothetical protein [Aeropyrum pernix]